MVNVMELDDTNLRDRLARFDGRTTEAVGAIGDALAARPDADARLIACLSDPRPTVADGATWIIKSRTEAGIALSPADLAALTGALSLVTGWPAQLHLCQIAGALPLTPDQRARWVVWASPLLQHDRPFVRAWALDCLCRLSPDAGGMSQHLTVAARDPAASVRARARKLAKELG